MKAVVSEKGQVTIPKALRERLGILPGQVLEFEEDGGRLTARKAAPVDPVDAVYGILQLDEPVDRFIDRVRGEADAPGGQPDRVPERRAAEEPKAIGT